MEPPSEASKKGDEGAPTNQNAKPIPVAAPTPHPDQTPDVSSDVIEFSQLSRLNCHDVESLSIVVKTPDIFFKLITRLFPFYDREQGRVKK